MVSQWGEKLQIRKQSKIVEFSILSSQVGTIDWLGAQYAPLFYPTQSHPWRYGIEYETILVMLNTSPYLCDEINLIILIGQLYRYALV